MKIQPTKLEFHGHASRRQGFLLSIQELSQLNRQGFGARRSEAGLLLQALHAYRLQFGGKPRLQLARRYRRLAPHLLQRVLEVRTLKRRLPCQKQVQNCPKGVNVSRAIESPPSSLELLGS